MFHARDRLAPLDELPLWDIWYGGNDAFPEEVNHLRDMHRRDVTQLILL
jgi:hypothetical protein